ELVVVIVILGILAVTAMPRFLDLQIDSRIAALEGAIGAIQDANSLVYSKTAIEGVETEEDLDGTEIGYPGTQITYGYMRADDETLKEFVEGFEGKEWVLEDDYDVKGNWNTRIYLADFGEHDQSFLCHIQYERASTEGVRPRVLINTEDC
ncbi:hypothetical protein BCV08_18885, partial [Vibrio breoganii]